MASPTQAQPSFVRFGRRQSKGVLLGFSGSRVVAIAGALIVFIAALLAFGAAGIAVSVPVWLPMLSLAFVRWRGEPAADAAPVVIHWGARVAAGQTRYRVRPMAPRPAGTLALPGDAAALRCHVDDVTGAAMIHDPHRRTIAAVVRVSHPAYVLLSPGDQVQRVASWSRVLAGLAATGSCAGVQVIESTLPDPGRGVRDWYLENQVPGPSWPAQQYENLLDDAAPASYTHRTLLVLSLDLRRAGRAIREAGRGMAGAAAVLRGDMATLAGSLRAAELRTDGWLEPTELAAVVRETYDPSVNAADCHASLSTAGPMALDEHWDYVRHDSAYSTVLWISEWPRVDVAPHFLHSIIFLPEVRKSLSMIAKPLGTGEALRAIRKEKVEYVTEADQNARIGKLPDFATEQEYADVLARERALTSGHADLRFSGFIVVTAGSRDALANAVAAAERAAMQCGCETRMLAGRQAQAFTAAALPLGRSVH